MNQITALSLEITSSPYILLAGIAAVIAVIVLIVRYAHYQYTKPADYSTKNSKIPTNGIILHRITKFYEFESDEVLFLKKLCSSRRVPNLEYTFHFEATSDKFFTRRYEELSNQTGKPDDAIQNEIALLFSIKQKVDNSRKSLSNLTSTTLLPVGNKIYYFADTKEQFEAEILDNTKNELVLSIPRDLFNNPIKPPVLSKISLIYQTKNGSAYLSDVRIIRYQDTTGFGEMVTNHCNNVQSFQRRQFKRINMNIPCTFSAVKITTGGTGKKADIEYAPMERKYNGQLLELSAGGCSILTNMNIREKQYIHINMNLDEDTSESVVGLIVNTSPVTDRKQYVLHILFVRISCKTRNKIFARVYEYRK